jgi:hypothetical protein
MKKAGTLGFPWVPGLHWMPLDGVASIKQSPANLVLQRFQKLQRQCYRQSYRHDTTVTTCFGLFSCWHAASLTPTFGGMRKTV